MRFRAELESTGRTAAGFEVPEPVVEELGGGGHPKVAVTVNGFTFRTSIAKMGGRYLLGVSAARREEAGIEAGQVLDVDVELDTAPRELDVPDDLAAALAADAKAKAFWDTLSHSKQSWHVHQVTSAKKAETRASRVEKSVAMLREGRAR
ncbi:YdeI/OmpD-associated family protein [Qaidamihabitans albus]|uniref:YdeI/OmpD-associated family protein n=1 Tax=Qaidamihabitans albus TaxID=2795733 RepID=UPI0018F1FBDE|nr:YdeI/OmpD-associated family protein [Qaidamihabitans albus]